MSDRPVSGDVPPRLPRMPRIGDHVHQHRIDADGASPPRRPRVPSGDIGQGILQLLRFFGPHVAAPSSQGVSDANTAVDEHLLGGKRKDG